MAVFLIESAFNAGWGTAACRAKMTQRNSISSGEIEEAVGRLSTAIRERCGAAEKLFVLGIANGGVELARRIAAKISAKCGVIDVSFHRDDIGRHPIPKEFAPTVIPGDVSGATIVLVDDVLFSGRTVNAALNELFDHGRPARVELAVLIDRNERRLPIAADFVGFSLPVPQGAKVVVKLDAEKPSRDSVRIV